MADPIMEIPDSARSQVERDLARHVVDKVCKAVHDAWELIEDDPDARTRIAVLASVAAMGSASAAMHEACLQRKGPTFSERDAFFAILEILAKNCPASLKDYRRG